MKRTEWNTKVTGIENEMHDTSGLNMQCSPI